LYGRAESPYNLRYSTTAYASGSSNGSGTSTTAAFAAFGFGGETVTSGRSPASNNALVGYSPSRGVIPNRGLWPLYPTCDVIIPHTRSVADLFEVLNIIVADDLDDGSRVDFWRSQKVVPIPKASEIRPTDYRTLHDSVALAGKRIAVPRRYIGGGSSQTPTVCVESVRELWAAARADLESCGATVVETGFPLIEQYEKKEFEGQGMNVPGMSPEWASIERCQTIAMAWDDFLRANGSAKYPNLLSADPDQIHPHIAPMDDPIQHTEAQNQVRYIDMLDIVRNRSASDTIECLPGASDAIKALEAMRKNLFEDWMDQNHIDLVAFPTNGDVPYSDADESRESMHHALQDGIKYANGGRALKHLGVPCITVPMGNMKDKSMPVGLTFCGKAWEDESLLKYAFAYEAKSSRRTLPPLTPSIPTDFITLTQRPTNNIPRLNLSINIDSTDYTAEANTHEDIRHLRLSGSLVSDAPLADSTSVTVYYNGEAGPACVKQDKWSWSGRLVRSKRVERFPTIARVPKDQFMVYVIAKASNGESAGTLVLLD
jgi:Asp-tRNA(Asn)/Glu-tRNA(Gln) amidotransferase A subunit family amidase